MREKAFGLFVSILVATVVIIGLMLVGSPLKERQRRFDAQRVQELSQISSAIDQFVEKNGTLPATLTALTNPEVARYYSVSSLQDPETAKPYHYAITGKSSYQLCATFALASTVKNFAWQKNPYDRAWEHPAGNKCFNLNSEQKHPASKPS